MNCRAILPSSSETSLLPRLLRTVFLAVILLTAKADAAIDAFLKVTNIPGEAQDARHAKEIDVLAWSWGMSNSATNKAAAFQELSITKYVDKATPLLLDACAKGAVIEECVLTVRKAGGDNPVEYIVITLHKVTVASLTTGGSGGQDLLTENISLQYGAIKYVYTPQKQDGTPLTPIPFTWSVEHNDPNF